MGKRGPKNRHHGKGSKGNKKPKGEWKVRTIPDQHQLFRDYYIEQLGLEKQDFEQFWEKMKQKLPIVFRVNPNCPLHQSFCEKIQNQEFIKGLLINQQNKEEQKKEKQEKNEKDEKMIEQKSQILKKEDNNIKQENQKQQTKQVPKLEVVSWYPGNLVYTMNTNKHELKKSKFYSEFHKYLQKAFDSGLISRQELVSMLPPLYLNVTEDDIVLDVCAAPGSKTSQILQMMYGEKRWLAKGCVIANDAEYTRAQMLIHQLHRSGTAGMVAINHAGQFLPQLYTQKINSIKQKFQFDKILCDVPCSGDGATRKIPIKWLNWHSSDGMVLHPLQLSILMKAMNLLKKGGFLVYSTCSLNPIQNEAVISALFQKVTKGLQIVDIHPLFGVKGRRGLLKWKVLAIEDKQQEMKEGQQNNMKQNKKYLREYKNYQDAKHIRKVKQSMFPICEEEAQKIGLHHTMRILPHDQNSGGFYVALLKKLPNFQWKYGKTKKQQIPQKMTQKNQFEEQQEFLKQNLPEVENPIPKQHQDMDEQKKQQQQPQEEEQENQIQIMEEKNPIQKQKIEENQQENKKKKNKGNKYQTFEQLKSDQFENIQKFFGLDECFRKLLYVRQNANQKKKIILVSEGVRQFLEADSNSKIKIVNMGIQAFERNKQSFAGNQCFFRLCQDGIHFLLNHIKLRKIKVDLSFFKKIIAMKSLPHHQIQNLETQKQIRQLTQGSFCLYIDENIQGKHVVDVIVGQNFKNSFHTMVSKQDTESLIMRYL